MKYKVGDKVIPIAGNGGVYPSNVEEMDKMVGKICTIHRIHNDTLYLEEIPGFTYSINWIKTI